MTTPLFDTLRATQSLKEAGFEQEQAEAIVSTIHQGLTDGVATKADLNMLKSELIERLAGTEGRLTTMFSKQITDLTTSLNEQLTKQMRWMTGLLMGTGITVAGTVIAILKLLPSTPTG
jgi:hypothetical protein